MRQTNFGFNAQSQHNRKYAESEEQHRLSVFQDNLRKIEKHNAEAAAGLHTYRLALNKFSDLVSFGSKQWPIDSCDFFFN